MMEDLAWANKESWNFVKCKQLPKPLFDHSSCRSLVFLEFGNLLQPSRTNLWLLDHVWSQQWTLQRRPEAPKFRRLVLRELAVSDAG